MSITLHPSFDSLVFVDLKSYWSISFGTLELELVLWPKQADVFDPQAQTAPISVKKTVKFDPQQIFSIKLG